MINLNKNLIKISLTVLFSLVLLVGTVYPVSTSAFCCNQPEANTENATNIDDNSATLNGYIDGNGLSTRAWFEYGRDRKMTSETSQNSYGSGNRDISKNITGLREDTVYYFRMVAENNDGTSYGDTYSFRTDSYGNYNNNYYYNDPYHYNNYSYRNDRYDLNILTTGATNVGTSSANLNATVSNDSDMNANAYFEWGQNQNLGYTTPLISVGNFRNINHVHTLTGLRPNTTYYFRAVVDNSYTREYGSVLSFTTGGSTYVPEPTVRTVVVKEPVYIQTPAPINNTNNNRNYGVSNYSDSSNASNFATGLGANAIGAPSFLPQNLIGWVILLVLFLVLLALVRRVFDKPAGGSHDAHGHH